MSGGRNGPRVDKAAERRRTLVTITASGRRPPRLDGAVSLTLESKKAFFKEHGSHHE